MDPAALVALAIGMMGLGGIIFTALKYNRDDTTAIVNQQNFIVGEMKTLNEELRTTNVDLRNQVKLLTEQVSALRQELGSVDR